MRSGWVGLASTSGSRPTLALSLLVLRAATIAPTGSLVPHEQGGGTTTAALSLRAPQVAAPLETPGEMFKVLVTAALPVIGPVTYASRFADISEIRNGPPQRRS
jgi:hypothetical protein